MSSIFDLPTSVDALDSLNDDMTRVGYNQVSATRDVTGASFANGTQHYKWTTASTQWWIPSRSYFRMRVKITSDTAGANQLALGDDIAPNMGLCSNLFQSAEIRLQGKTISRISDFLPQIDALETRMDKSKAYLDGAGASLNLWQPSVAERKTVMASDAPALDKSGAKDVFLTSLVAPNTVAVGVNGVFTFAQGGGGGAVVPDLTALFVVGDDVEIAVAGGLTYNIKVAATTANTLTSSSSQVNAGASPITSVRRIRPVSASRSVKEIELIWKPPLALMKHERALPTGAWEIVLNPHNSSAYQKYGIESAQTNKTAGTDFTLSVDEMFFYCAVVEGERFDTGSYVLDLDNTSCQVNQVSQSGFGQKDFTVSPSTYALTAAYQDSRVGTDSRISSTKFKSYDANVTEADQTLDLERFFINYNSQNFPQPDADPRFGTGVDKTAQRYVETQIMTGNLFNEGGPESIGDFHSRGSYFHFKCPQDAGSRATRCIVHQGFKNATDVTNMRLLLFSHHKSVMYVSVKDGNVLSVDVEDM